MTTSPEELVVKFKTQGFFDKIRKRCLENVEKSNDYPYLLRCVDDFVSAYLNTQPPKQPKLELRENLRKELCATSFLRNSVSKMVIHVLNNHPLVDLKGQVHRFVCESLDISYDQWVSDRATRKELSTIVPSLRKLEESQVNSSLLRNNLPTTTLLPPDASAPFSFPPPALYPPIVPSTKNSKIISGFKQTSRTLLDSLAGILPKKPVVTSPLIRHTILTSPFCTEISSDPILLTPSELVVGPTEVSICQDEEIGACDDAMEMDSSDSELRGSNFNISDHENEISENVIHRSKHSNLPGSEEDFLNFSRINSHKVIWQGMQLELDDISDEETSYNRRQRIAALTEGSPISNHAYEMSRNDSPHHEEASISPLRKHFSTQKLSSILQSVSPRPSRDTVDAYADVISGDWGEHRRCPARGGSSNRQSWKEREHEFTELSSRSSSTINLENSWEVEKRTYRPVYTLTKTSVSKHSRASRTLSYHGSRTPEPVCPTHLATEPGVHSKYDKSDSNERQRFRHRSPHHAESPRRRPSPCMADKWNHLRRSKDKQDRQQDRSAITRYGGTSAVSPRRLSSPRASQGSLGKHSHKKHRPRRSDEKRPSYRSDLAKPSGPKSPGRSQQQSGKTHRTASSPSSKSSSCATHSSLHRPSLSPPRPGILSPRLSSGVPARDTGRNRSPFRSAPRNAITATWREGSGEQRSVWPRDRSKRAASPVRRRRQQSPHSLQQPAQITSSRQGLPRPRTTVEERKLQRTSDYEPPFDVHNRDRTSLRPSPAHRLTSDFGSYREGRR